MTVTANTTRTAVPNPRLLEGTPYYEAVPVPSTTTSKQVFNGECLFGGMAFYNAGGSATIIRVYDGEDTTAGEIAILTIAATTAGSYNAPAGGIHLLHGLYLSIAGGSPEGACFLTKGFPR